MKRDPLPGTKPTIGGPGRGPKGGKGPIESDPEPV